MRKILLIPLLFITLISFGQSTPSVFWQRWMPTADTVSTVEGKMWRDPVTHKFRYVSGGVRRTLGAAGGGGSISALTAASAINTINNSTYTQEWQWNTLGAATGLLLSSSSTAAASNTNLLFGAIQTGANATSTQTTRTGSLINQKTGTSATNVALELISSGGTNNYALDLTGNIRLQSGATGTSIVGGKLILGTTSTYAGINLTGISGNPSSTTAGDMWYSTTGGGSINWKRGGQVYYLLTSVGFNAANRVPYTNGTFEQSSTNVFTYDGALIGIASAVSTGTGATSGFRLVANGLTTGTAAEKSTSSLTTGFLSNHISTSTAINHTAGTSGVVGINVSGANSTSAKTVIGLHSKVTNTNATSGTNIAAVLSASGATTANYALWAIGNIMVNSSNALKGVNVNTGGSFSAELTQQGLDLFDGAVNSTIGILSGGGISIQAGIGEVTPTDSYFDVDNGDLYLRASIGSGTGSLILSGAGGIEAQSSITLSQIGHHINIKEGSGGFMGQATLTSGTNAITVSGVTTSTRCFATMVTPSGTTLTTSYQCVCTANTVTLQANVAAGTINTADGSTLNYILFEPAP